MKNIMSYFPKDETKFYIVLFSILFVVYTIFQLISVFVTSFEYEIEIHEKYINSGESPKFSVIDTRGNTYLIVDRFFLLEFNSGDDYAMMKEGEKYNVKGYWFRFPLLSWYPQIYAVEKI